MAKLAFSKLGLKNNNQVVNINYNEQTIEVKQYISVNDKLKLISDIINNTVDEHSFCNPVKVKVYLLIGIIENYTNISFTEKQKEDVYKLYDSFSSSFLMNQILSECERDYRELQSWTFDILSKIYDRQNSARGILEALTTDYNNLNFDVEKLQSAISDPENLTLLKDVLSKLG